MAQRRKRATPRKGKSAPRGKALKSSKSGQRTATKRIIAKQIPRKRSTKTTPRLAPAKKVTRKRARPFKLLADYEISNTAARWFSRA